jgi:hypothetical protein
MGQYINKGNTAFREARNSEYVDKSGLIAVINSTLFTEQRFTCVSRSRRFGKSMAVKMLAAYYDHSCYSRELFSDLEIANDPSFEKHMNKYPVIYLDITNFVTHFQDEGLIALIEQDLKASIAEAYPQVETTKDDDLMAFLYRIVEATGSKFIFVIDEWDTICREFPPESPMMNKYVDWLRRMFKSDQAIEVFAGVYMTGILPIKKYKTQSALNNFREYSMADPGKMETFFGFTRDEVKALSAKYNMDYDEMERWYDGYQIGMQTGMFNPNSVMQAVYNGYCDNYWRKTASYEAIVPYIKMNFDGLKDDIVALLAGGRVKVNTTKFQNDLSIVNSKDDVLTVLIHLGYLSFGWSKKECYVPNYEVSEELQNAVEDSGWTEIMKTLQKSEQLLSDTLAGKAEAVAAGIDRAHDENTSILSYNDENSMACVLSIAYIYAKGDYIIHREYASGKGFADLVLIPRKNVDSPALVIELKYDQDADTAIDQIKRKNYPTKVAEYADNLLLVGISYDKKTKKHTCVIESFF